METLSYRLDLFDGPLDLLLSLIQKNKLNIEDIPINLICEQYMEYISAAQAMDMDIASEFLVMASELMLIKSKLLLPKICEEEEDPRLALAEMLIKYQQAKEAAKKLLPEYAKFSGRLEKDTDEISIDKSFVADQETESLLLAVRRILTYNENRPLPDKEVFTPMISKPIVPVEVKIVGIMNRMSQKRETSLRELLDDSVSLNDMIAIFLGVLELIKVRRILISGDESGVSSLMGEDAKFIINENLSDETADETEKGKTDEGHHNLTDTSEVLI